MRISREFGQPRHGASKAGRAWRRRSRPKRAPTRHMTSVISTPRLHKRTLEVRDFDHTSRLPTALPFWISVWDKYDRKHERWPANSMGPPVSAIPHSRVQGVVGGKVKRFDLISARVTTTTTDRPRVKARANRGFALCAARLPVFPYWRSFLRLQP